MPTYKDEEGNIIEGLMTPDEVEEKLNKTVEEVKSSFAEEKEQLTKEYEDKIQEYDSKLSDLEKERNDIQGNIEEEGDDKSKNFKVLKEALNKKDQEIEELRGEIKKVDNNRVTDYANELIDKFAGEDEELKKKIQHHYNETLKAVEASDKGTVADKVKDAFKLSATAESIDPLSNAISGSVGRTDTPGSKQETITAEEKEMGSKLGLSEEDYKKYAK